MDLLTIEALANFAATFPEQFADFMAQAAEHITYRGDTYRSSDSETIEEFVPC